jgi:UDP-N-acetyl-2-amino-2-deoxyglucuronate dehydrogenase
LPSQNTPLRVVFSAYIRAKIVCLLIDFRRLLNQIKSIVTEIPMSGQRVPASTSTRNRARDCPSPDHTGHHEALGFTLFGCGHIGQRYAHLLSSAEVDGARLEAVFDPDAERAKAFADKYGASVLKDPPVGGQRKDVACILSPSGLHAAEIIRLAPSFRHVVVEKPICLTEEDGTRMIAACQTAGTTLHVVQQHRLSPSVARLMQALKSGRLGHVRMLDGVVRVCRPDRYYRDGWHGSPELDGGVLPNQALHLLDLMLLVNGMPARVHAMGRIHVETSRCHDSVVATFEYDSGALASLTATAAIPHRNIAMSLFIAGSRGVASLEGPALNDLALCEDAAGPICAEDGPDLRDGDNHARFLSATVVAIRAGRPPLVTAEEALRSVRLFTSIHESIRSGRLVDLPAAHPETAAPPGGCAAVKETCVDRSAIPTRRPARPAWPDCPRHSP